MRLSTRLLTAVMFAVVLNLGVQLQPAEAATYTVACDTSTNTITVDWLGGPDPYTASYQPDGQPGYTDHILTRDERRANHVEFTGLPDGTIYVQTNDRKGGVLGTGTVTC